MATERVIDIAIHIIDPLRSGLTKLGRGHWAITLGGTEMTMAAVEVLAALALTRCCWVVSGVDARWLDYGDARRQTMESEGLERWIPSRAVGYMSPVGRGDSREEGGCASKLTGRRWCVRRLAGVSAFLCARYALL